MDTEHNTTFIKAVSDWSGVSSFAELKKGFRTLRRLLVVTHAFAIKTLLYLFAPEQLCAMEKVKNAAILWLIYDEGKIHFYQ